jgi:hypothetical protein
MRNIAHAELHETTAPKLAIDGQIEQREFPDRSASCKRMRTAQMSLSLSGAF